jgi:hypothetical protein
MFLRFKKNRFFTFHFSLVTLHLFVVCLSGCSTAKKIQHLPQLLTLKSYSDSQGSIKKEAEQADKMFDEIVVEIEAGQFDYQTAVEVQKRFGEPVFKREAEYQGQMCEQWLYRKAKDFSGEDGKVYMYFDNEGQLVNFEYVKGEQ